MEEQKTLEVKQTAYQEALKAKSEYEQLRQSAIDELLAKRKKINDQLAELGYEQTKTSGTVKAPEERYCDICSMHGHDKRNHRGQDPIQKFTQSELKEKGLL